MQQARLARQAAPCMQAGDEAMMMRPGPFEAHAYPPLDHPPAVDMGQYMSQHESSPRHAPRRLCVAFPSQAVPCSAPALPLLCPALPTLPCLPCSAPALPCPALPCPALPCPALPCPALPLLCPALPALLCSALPCPALPCSA
jgi:hypothetical protein